MISNFQHCLEDDIEAKLPSFANANKQKYESFIVSVRELCAIVHSKVSGDSTNETY